MTHLAPPVVAETLRSPGRPLPEPTRTSIERRLGHDFGHVRIHTDSEAARSARAVGAHAYAVGRDVVFDEARFHPDSAEGQTLLTHELTHVLQQGAGDARGLTDLPIAVSDGAAEREALTAAGAANLSSPPLSPTPSPFAVARQVAEGERARVWPPAAKAPRIRLHDEDASVSRWLAMDSPEFLRDYIDNNIADAGFWDTPYAHTDPKYRRFLITYDDGRQLWFSLDDVPVRRERKDPPGKARVERIAYPPTFYFKRGGFIYPDLYADTSIPRLIDVATAVRWNHRRREQFLEIATTTFVFQVSLASLATAGMPTGGGAAGRPPPRRVPGKGGGGGEPPPPAPTGTRPSGATKTKQRVPETGTAGSRSESATAAARRERMAPKPSLSPRQQAIADELVTQHPDLSPRVAAEACVGAERGAGAGGAGADVILFSGGGREVSVHSGAFTLENVGTHLVTEAGQAGTTQIYLQINTQGATRATLLGMMPRLQRGYVDLQGVFVKIFGPNGEAWWSGVFRFTGG